MNIKLGFTVVQSGSSHESKEFEEENIIRCKNKQFITVTAYNIFMLWQCCNRDCTLQMVYCYQ